MSSSVALSPTSDRYAEVYQLLSGLGYDVGASLVILSDLNGYTLCHWSRLGDVDTDTIAMLGSASLAARIALVAEFGASSSSVSIVHEYDTHTLLLLHIGANLAMLVAVESAFRLGWLRVAAKRVGQEVVAVLADS